MKKISAICLVLVLVISMFVVAGCGGKTTDEPKVTLKFGAGVFVSALATTDATADKEGTGKVDATIAAVTVDADGKIVACALDTASNTVKFTADGKAVANTEFKTKYELGNDYNMVTYGGAAKEWFEQADAFEGVVVGKTLAQIKALVVEDTKKGTDEVVTAGCTIMINDFVSAIEKAYNNAADANVTKENVLKVIAVTEQTCTDATADKDGSNKVATTFFAAAIDANGKVVVASSDCVEVAFSFNTQGASTFDATKAVLTKKEKGTDYGMVAYAGSAKEWFEQAAAFDAACVGKTATEISALMAEDGKGVESLQTAGCTIYVTGFVKAAAKIG